MGKLCKGSGNYIANDLTESEETRHKRVDFIWRANGILVKYQDAVPEVKMYLLNSYCCHLYGSQAWCFADKRVGNITTAWNKAIRKILKLLYDSHGVLFCGLNNGQHICDYIFKRFCKMYDCMSNSTNSILSFLISMSENDCQWNTAKNVRHICDKWKFQKQTYGRIVNQINY